LDHDSAERRAMLADERGWSNARNHLRVRRQRRKRSCDAQDGGVGYPGDRTSEEWSLALSTLSRFLAEFRPKVQPAHSLVPSPLGVA
jgi:hypothetical protein